MDRRNFLKKAALMAGGAAFSKMAAPAAAAISSKAGQGRLHGKTPNVIFILADDTGCEPRITRNEPL